MTMSEKEFRDLSNYISQLELEARLRSLIVQIGVTKSRRILSQIETRFYLV